ncbi:MAG: NUDIX hydrolase [Weeksellaceae bacterium]
MYKVFVNNKLLTFGSTKLDIDRNIPFINNADFDVAIDLLNNNADEVHIYSNEIEEVWTKFTHHYKQINAAGGVVINDHNEMLWIYRLGKWDLPKGKMEKGENIEATALREVEEECGISDLKITKRLDDTFHMYYHKEHILKITHWFEMRYYKDEKLVPQLEEGITDVQWVPINELSKPMKNTYGNIYNLVKRYLD